jgi:hypothetical protein
VVVVAYSNMAERNISVIDVEEELLEQRLKRLEKSVTILKNAVVTVADRAMVSGNPDLMVLSQDLLKVLEPPKTKGKTKKKK